MKFVFYDKSKVEMEVITDLLHEENIPYKIKKIVIKDFFLDDDEEEDIVIIEENYNIECYTDLNHFDFIKLLADTRIRNRINLEKCYMREESEVKNVQRIHKKNPTNTDNKN